MSGRFEDVYPLSAVQQGLLFHHLYAPHDAFYLDQVVLPLAGPLDLGAFAAAWRAVVARHPALRTSFHWQDLERPLQVVHPRVRLPVSVVDASGLPPAAVEAELRRLLAADRRRGFELGQPPLLRLTVLRAAAADHRVVWSYHHLVLDAWSGSVIFAEVFQHCAAAVTGQGPALPPAVPFRRYLRWLKAQDAAAATAHWRAELGELREPTPLPADGSEAESAGEVGRPRGEVAAELDAATTAALQRLAREHRLTLNTLVQGAWALALAAASGRREVVFGVTVSGRPPAVPGVESIVGMLVNTLPLRATVDPAADLLAWLAALQARQSAQSAFEGSSLADVQAVSGLGPGRALFASILAFENVPGAELAAAGGGPGLRIGEPRYLFRTNYPLTAQVIPGSTLRWRLAFAPERLSPTAARRFLDRVLGLLAAFAAAPGRRLGELPVLAAAERQAVLTEWSGGATPYPRETTLDRLVAARVRATPDAVAVVAEAGVVEALSYAELDRRAGRLALALRRRGVGPEVAVGVAAGRSLELVANLLGVVQAGGVYVPLDAELPAERLRFLAAEARLAALVGGAGVARLEALGLPAVAPAAASELGAGVPQACAAAENLVYVLFTSGSTGQPKGVAVPHRGVVRLVAENPFVRFGPGEVLVQTAPVAFDASTFEIWGALAHGARLVVAPAGPLGLEELADLLERWRVSTLWVTTGLFHQLAEHCPRAFATPTQVLTGGEAARPELFDRMLRERAPGARLFHAYGPTECTTFATGETLSTGGGLAVAGAPAATVPIGRAIANTWLRLLDGELRPVPAGAPGELHLGGDGLARGYLGRPGLTAARFVPDPFAGLGARPGARLYRTGDRVRQLADGRLVFLGRLDQQVKIRGFRIEPGEVEVALAAHPAVAGAVVTVREDRPGERRLVAYVVAHGAAHEEAAVAEAELVARLREHLAATLPAFMVPAAFVVLAALPLGANGKVDRRALPAPEEPAAAAGLRAAPASDLEAELARLWAHLLGRQEVGRDESFFDLGGHSLHATQLVSQLRQSLGIELALRTVFEQPTIAQLAAAIVAGQAQPAAASPLTAASGSDAPLSFAQERLWFLDRLEPGLAAYNVPFVLAIDGPLRPAVLRQALSAVVARHAVLRSRVLEVDGAGVQRVAPAAPVPLPEIDLRGFGMAAETAARGLAERELRLPFDLARGPLLRARLLRLPTDRCWLLLTLHHIVTDGWSMGILLDEASRLYEAFAAGRPSPLAPLSRQYADHALWQRAWLQGAELDRQLAYWRQQLAGLPPALELPCDRPRPPVQTYRGGRRPLALGADLSRGLQELAARQRVTLFMVLATGLAALLARLTASTDIPLGTVVANRNRAESEGLIGFFVNTLVLRQSFAGDPELGQLLARSREVTLAAYAHQDLPFERLVAELGGQRNLAVTPLFQVLLVLQNTPLAERRLAGLTMTPVEIDPGMTKFDLQLSLESRGPAVTGALEYNGDLFDASTAERLGRQLRRVLAALAAGTRQRLSELPLLAAAEAWQLRGEWAPGPALPAGENGLPAAERGLLHAGFLAQAVVRPEAVALVAGEERLSYAALVARATALAGRLAGLGVGPEVRVAVALERTAELPVALLATLLAGGAYVPLDLTYPGERLATMLADSAAAVLLTTPRAAAVLPAEPGRTVVAVGGDGGPVPAAEGIALPAPQPANLAYLIYTSGSTGRPKGVAITHANAAALLAWALETFPVAALAGTLAATSVCFDLSVFELFVPLAAGTRVVLVANALELAELPAAAEVTLVNTVPSAMVELVERGGLPAAAATICLAGEPLQASLVAALHAQPAVREVWNLYGPSEDTTYSTAAKMPRADARAPAIGRPVTGGTAHVLGRDGRPLPAGVLGELSLGGAGLARGYLGRPGLTAARFVPDPFADLGGGRLYRTGDLVRQRADGSLEFHGRLDHQVKLRGYRIELGEIEAALSDHPGVREAAVVARDDHGELRLVAYVAPAGDELDPALLRAHLLARLPIYMLPAVFVSLASLPLTPSGKLDRRALPAPGGERRLDAAGFVAPRTATEERLAALWAEALGVDRVGVRDNFFELGGHSLLLMRLQSRLKAQLGAELPMVELFALPTVEALARRLDAAAAPAPGDFEHSAERAERKREQLAGRRARAAGRGR